MEVAKTRARGRAALIAALCALGIGAPSASGRDVLDPTFRDGGAQELEPYRDIFDMSVYQRGPQAGKVAVVGYTYPLPSEIVVTRLGPDGEPDASFGADGSVVAPQYIDGIAALPDGSLLLSGPIAHGMVVLRMNADGSFDPAYGDDGALRLEPSRFKAGTTSVSGYNHQLLTLGDELMIGGNLHRSDGTGGAWLARVTADGELDRSFSRDGVWATPKRYGSAAYSEDLARAGRGRIVSLLTVNEADGFDVATQADPHSSLLVEFTRGRKTLETWAAREPAEPPWTPIFRSMVAIPGEGALLAGTGQPAWASTWMSTHVNSLTGASGVTRTIEDFRVSGLVRTESGTIVGGAGPRWSLATLNDDGTLGRVDGPDLPAPAEDLATQGDAVIVTGRTYYDNRYHPFVARWYPGEPSR